VSIFLLVGRVFESDGSEVGIWDEDGINFDSEKVSSRRAVQDGATYFCVSHKREETSQGEMLFSLMLYI